MNERLFKSFLIGDFKCSTHRARSGKRINVIAATRHDEFAEQDTVGLFQWACELLVRGALASD